VALEIKQYRGQFDARQTVGQGMMDLFDQPHTTSLQPFDKPQLPEWMGTVQGYSEELGA
jgi:hypothetical protein